jgi:protein-disulfide isomerase
MRFRTLTVLLGCVLTLAISAWGQQSPPAPTAHVPTSGAVPMHANPGNTPAPNPANSLNPQLAQSIEAYVRETFAFGKAFQLQFGPPKDALLPGFYEVPVQVIFQGRTQSAVFYVSKDGKLLIQGNVSRIVADPFADNRKLLTVGDSPTIGPDNATVTVYEFSDFQCPHCKVFAESLKEITPKYPQVRFVYKNFPLEQIHPWALSAALAARCALQTSNDAFWKVSDSIFQDQSTLTAEDAPKQLKGYAVAAGVPAAAYDACIANPATKAAIDKDIALGMAVEIGSTPTVFVNGRPLPGGEPQLLGQSIEYELEKTVPIEKAPSIK